MSGCPNCPRPGTGRRCPLHWLSRVILPAELSAIGLDEMAIERESGTGKLADLERVLDSLEAVAREDANARRLLVEGFRLTAQAWPKGPLGVPVKALTPVMSACQRVRALRMLKDGSLAAMVDGRRVVESVESEEVEYVAPRGTRRGGAEYLLEVVR